MAKVLKILMGITFLIIAIIIILFISYLSVKYKDVTPENTQEDNDTTSTRLLYALGSFVGVLLIGGIVAAIYYNKKTKSSSNIINYHHYMSYILFSVLYCITIFYMILKYQEVIACNIPSITCGTYNTLLDYIPIKSTIESVTITSNQPVDNVAVKYKKEGTDIVCTTTQDCNVSESDREKIFDLVFCNNSNS